MKWCEKTKPALSDGTPAPRVATTPSPLWFHLLAGPNGAGKSTLHRALVCESILGPPLEFVNADLYERDHLQHITGAQQRSEAARAQEDRVTVG